MKVEYLRRGIDGAWTVEPGPELDQAVAEAIGWHRSEQYPRDWMSAEGRTYPIQQFRPSVDLNAAFAAAEKVGLFLDEWCYLGPSVAVRGAWGVFEEDMSTLRRCLSTAPTPALALCAAILFLKENDDETT
jgi:hypothetical protein